MNHQETRLVEIIDAVTRYLDRHPEAADTAEGIAKWWLPPGAGAEVHLVETALVRMLAQGRVKRQNNIDRHVLYSIGKKDGA